MPPLPVVNCPPPLPDTSTSGSAYLAALRDELAQIARQARTDFVLLEACYQIDRLLRRLEERQRKDRPMH